MLGEAHVEQQIAQDHGRDNARNQDRRQHCGDDDVKQIVAGIQGGNTDQQSGNHVEDSGARNFVIDCIAQPGDDHPARQVRNGGQSDQRGQDQCGGGQYERSPDVAGFSRNRGEQGSGERQRQSQQREEEFQPEIGMFKAHQCNQAGESARSSGSAMLIGSVHERKLD